MECPNCHAEVSGAKRYCIQCGATLRSYARMRLAQSGGRAILRRLWRADGCGLRGTVTAPAERRQLTVIFVDLVGSTALFAKLDPEDMRDIVFAYHRCCTAEISKSSRTT